ncbi:hypothetical protein ACFVAJ_17660 [Agromyces sp. NPDC057679]|uniref:hypothetical protein n=1 Tax=Agromyces sp. NPDC057679 TaxID=3346207 RepID=UPI00366CEF51
MSLTAVTSPSFTEHEQSRFDILADELFELRIGFAYEAHALQEAIALEGLPDHRLAIAERTIPELINLAHGRAYGVAAPLEPFLLEIAEKNCDAEDLAATDDYESHPLLRALIRVVALNLTLAQYFSEVAEIHLLDLPRHFPVVNPINDHITRLRRMSSGDPAGQNRENSTPNRKQVSTRPTGHDALEWAGAPTTLTDKQLLEYLHDRRLSIPRM